MRILILAIVLSFASLPCLPHDLKITAYPGTPHEYGKYYYSDSADRLYFDARLTKNFPSGFSKEGIQMCSPGDYKKGVELSLRRLEKADVYSTYEVTAQVTTLESLEKVAAFECGQVFEPTLRHQAVTKKMRLIVNNPVVYMVDKDTPIVLELKYRPMKAHDNI